MSIAPRGPALLRLLAALAAAPPLAAGCAPSGPRPVVSQATNALPEPDPTRRGTVQGSMTLTESEQMVVRMGRDAAGQVVLLQVLSPTLTPEQLEEVRRAFAIGGWKREAPLPKQDDSWIETITRNR